MLCVQRSLPHVPVASWVFVLAFATSTGCTTAPAVVNPAEPSPEVVSPCESHLAAQGHLCADVAWLGDDRLSVSLTVAPRKFDGTPDNGVSLRFREKYFGTDYVARHIAMKDGGWPEQLPMSERVHLTYEVTLSDELHPEFGRGGISLRVPGGWNLRGRTFIPDVWVGDEVVQASVYLTFDPREKALLTAEGTTAHEFIIDSTLLDNTTFAVGEWTIRKRDRTDGVRIVAATGSPEDAGQLDAYLELTDTALLSVETHLGRFPHQNLLALHHRLPNDSWGEYRARSFIQTGATIPGDLLDEPTGVLIHELVHIWLPGQIAVHDIWIREGLTEYTTVLILNELLRANALDLGRVAARAYDAYTQDIGNNTLLSVPRDRLAYDAGIVAGYCIDTHLTVEGAPSLIVHLRELLDRSREEVTSVDLVNHLRKRAPQTASYVEQLLVTTGPVDLAPCLERAGLRRVAVGRRVPTPRTTAVKILGVLGLGHSSKRQGFTVSATAEDSVFHIGDHIQSISGESVSTLDDVAGVIATREGETLEVVLLRDRKPLTLTLKVPALTREETEQRKIFQVVPAKNLETYDPTNLNPNVSGNPTTP